MRVTAVVALRWGRRLSILALLVFVLWFRREFDIDRVAVDDASVFGWPGGTLLLSEPRIKDSPLVRDAVYLVAYPVFSPEGLDQEILRLARLVGLPGDSVLIEASRVEVGGQRLALPAEALHSVWPAQVSADCCLLLTDLPAARHPDSRSLGEIPVATLRKRVIVPLRF